MKKKLESRRLDFDAKLNKIHKSKKENPIAEEEVRVSQMKYEDSVSDITNRMLSFSAMEVKKQNHLGTIFTLLGPTIKRLELPYIRTISITTTKH